jgi:5'-deoxynucleotidase YfbR-like HD superfamily hydrolase
MPRKSAQSEEESEKEKIVHLPNTQSKIEEVESLSQMLAAVLEYISDEEVEEIDFEYILDHTEGLRKWWDRYQENNRKKIEDEIRNSLSTLSFEELQKIREQIKEK